MEKVETGSSATTWIGLGVDILVAVAVDCRPASAAAPFARKGQRRWRPCAPLPNESTITRRRRSGRRREIGRRDTLLACDGSVNSAASDDDLFLSVWCLRRLRGAGGKRQRAQSKARAPQRCHSHGRPSEPVRTRLAQSSTPNAANLRRGDGEVGTHVRASRKGVEGARAAPSPRASLGATGRIIRG